MPNYKIYRKNNYLFIQDTVTDEIISGLAKDVRVYRLEKTDGNAYKFINTSNDVKLASVPYTSIKEEDGTDFANEAAWIDFYTEFTGTTSTGGGGGSQTLPDTLLLGDREIKTVLVSSILAGTGDYTFEDGDESVLVVLNADNANDDTFTVTIPDTAPEFAEYKVLFTTGDNGFTNNVVTYTPTAGNENFGRTIQNSNENSIACIKVLQSGGNSSITYQSSVGDSALTTDQIDAINGSNSPSSSNVFATMVDVGGGSVKKEFVMYIGSQDSTGLLSTDVRVNTCDTSFTFTRSAIGRFDCPEFDPTIHKISFETTYSNGYVGFDREEFGIDPASKFINTFSAGSSSDSVLELGGWIKIEQY